MMPEYSFEKPSGEVIQEFFPIGTAPVYVLQRDDEGLPVLAWRNYAWLGNGKSTDRCWPMTSVSAGVAPHQAQEAYDKSVKDGVPTVFTKDGDPVFTSRSHRKKFLKTIGMRDRDGGYGD